jgi:hypothetical protein
MVNIWLRSSLRPLEAEETVMPQMHSQSPRPVAAVRSTTGQSLSVRYDPRSNTMIFAESDWFSDTLRSGGVPARGEVRQRLDAAVLQLKSRRR